MNLSAEKRDQLQEIISRGSNTVRTFRRASALLKSDEGWSDARIAKSFNMSIPTMERLRKRVVEEGVSTALYGRKSKQIYHRRLDGKREAQLIALVCSDAPEGEAKWSLRLLANHMVKLGYVDDVSYETVRRTLKKTS